MNSSNYLLITFIGLVLSGFIGAAIGQTKHRIEAGFMFGMLLGPIGWLLVGCGPQGGAAPKTIYKCPYCAEVVQKEAIICKHCHKELAVS